MNGRAGEKFSETLKENSLVKVRGADYRENGKPKNKWGKIRLPSLGRVTDRVDRPRSALNWGGTNGSDW